MSINIMIVINIIIDVPINTNNIDIRASSSAIYDKMLENLRNF